MVDFIVRPIKREELADLLDLYRYLNPADPVLPVDNHLLAHWEHILSGGERFYLGGECGGKLVSTCNISLIPNLTRSARPYGLIENVVTHPDYRGRGFAGQVLKAALELAWAHNCYKVMLLTSRKDEAVLNFYQKAGFKRGEKTGFVAHCPAHEP